MTDAPEPGERTAVVLAADNHYARPLAVVLRSLLQHLPPASGPDVYVLSDGIAPDARRRLLRVAERAGGADLLHWIEVDADVALGGLEGAAHVSRAAFMRMLTPRLLPASVGRALYLDTDVLVCDEVTPLLRLPLGEHHIAAARDQMFEVVPHPTIGPVTDYFNSGVMVIDLHAWRRNGFPERVLERAADKAGMRFADQDVMHVLGADWLEIAPEWNVQLGFLWRAEHATRFAERRRRLWRGRRIVHYTGGAKPWFFDTRLPGTLTWNRTLATSGWYSAGELVRWIVPWTAKRLLVRTGGWSAVGLARRARAWGRRS